MIFVKTFLEQVAENRCLIRDLLKKIKYKVLILS